MRRYKENKEWYDYDDSEYYDDYSAARGAVDYDDSEYYDDYSAARGDVDYDDLEYYDDYSATRGAVDYDDSLNFSDSRRRRNNGAKSIDNNYNSKNITRKNKKENKRKTGKARLIYALILVVCIFFAAIFAHSEMSNRGSSDTAAESGSGSAVTTGDGSDVGGSEKFLSQFSKEDRERLEKDAAAGNLILVNKQNSLPEDYVPEDLADILYYAEDRSPKARFMREEAASHFNLMVEDASSEGVDFVMTTAYRSYEFQTELFNYYVSQKGSEEEANKTSARPGQSEHQTGLAVDVSCADIDYRISDSFADTQAGKWLRKNCFKYGFILRYTAENENITGYLPEAWHFRYVGSVAAKYIWENDITLEEFLEQSGLTHSYEELYGQ